MGGLLKVNGRPLEEVEPKALQFKLMEPVLLLGKDRVVDTCPRCTPSDRPSLSPWSPTTRSLLTSRASRRSRTSSSSLIGPCWSLTRGETSPRSLEVPEPEQDTRSLTVKFVFPTLPLFLSTSWQFIKCWLAGGLPGRLPGGGARATQHRHETHRRSTHTHKRITANAKSHTRTHAKHTRTRTRA